MRALPLSVAVLVEALAFGQGFNKRFDAFEQQLGQGGWDIEQMVSGYAVISVSSDADSISPDSSFYHYSVLLTRLDQYGAKLSEVRSFRPLHGTTSGWANCSDTIPGGGYVVGGATESLPPAVVEVYLMRLNEMGDTLWTRVFGGAGQYWIGRQVKHTDDGGFLVVGDCDATGYIDGFVLKTDSLGNEQWRQTYGNGLIDYFIASDRATNGYILGGVKFLATDNSQLWVQRIDTAGAVLWQQIWGGSFEEPSAHLITLADGNILVASAWGYAIDFTSDRPYLAKLDSTDGSIIWDHEYGQPAYGTTFFAAKERPNGDLIACGVSYAGGAQQGLLLRTTSEGDSIWMRTYFYQDTLMQAGTGRFYDVLPTDDGGFIAAGAAYQDTLLGYPSGYSQDTWVVKVDSMGCIVPGCDGVGVSEIVTNLGGAISVFPNPAHGSAVVQVQLPPSFRNDPNLQLSVVNAQGQMVHRQSAQQGDNTLDMSTLSAGLYYLHLSTGSTWLAGGKVVVE